MAAVHDHTVSIWVDNLPAQNGDAVIDSELKAFFGTQGAIADIHVLRQKR